MNQRWIFSLALAFALVVPSFVLAHEGHAHTVMGTVSAVHAQDLEIKTTDGKTVVFLLNAKTIYQRGKTKVDGKTLTVGERVVVSALEVPAGKTMTAQTIQFASVAATK
jgi:hypothetical protein